MVVGADYPRTDWSALDIGERQAYLEPLRAAIGLKPTSAERAKSKPICASPVNPNVAAPTDCIPQHLANLPPDPGEAGKLTIDGIDADKDGVRDDVQRCIAENWGHSERAVAGLTIVAKIAQMRVHYGETLGKEDSRKLCTRNHAQRRLSQWDWQPKKC